MPTRRNKLSLQQQVILVSCQCLYIFLQLDHVHRQSSYMHVHAFATGFIFSRNVPSYVSLDHHKLKSSQIQNRLNLQKNDDDNDKINENNSKENQNEKILSNLDILYPSSDVSKRNSLSRTDGYWTFLENGQEPPKYLTYGEFDFLFFADLLDRAHGYHTSMISSSSSSGSSSSSIVHDDNIDNDIDDNNADNNVDKNEKWNDKTFVDIGSGTGRLVIGAAALYPKLKLCKGIEILPTLHQSAIQILNQCKDNIEQGEDEDYEDTKDHGIETMDGLDGEDDDDDYDDSEDDDGDEYGEPLSSGMNEMIGALQEMTAEEWKEILGDYVMEDGEEFMLDSEDLLEEQKDQEVIEEEQEVKEQEFIELNEEVIEEQSDKSYSIKDRFDSMVSKVFGGGDDVDGKGGEGDKDDNDGNDADDIDETDEIANIDETDDFNQALEKEKIKKDIIKKFRSSSEEINPNFILPSEGELLKDINFDNDNDEDSGIQKDIENDVDIDNHNDERGDDNENEDVDKSSVNAHYFESFDDFLSMSDERLLDFFGEERKDNLQSDYDIKTLEEQGEDGKHIDDEDEMILYDLKCPSTDENDLSLAPIKLSCGSFEDPYEYIGDADVVFVFSTCWTNDMMKGLGECIGRQCKPGTIAITTEFQIPLSGEIGKVESDPDLPFGEYELELVEKVDGYCDATGGLSTAFIHRVVRSLYQKGVGPRRKPKVSKEELAWNIIQDYESNQLTDTEKFTRNAKNALAFYSFDFNGENDFPI